MNTEPFRSGGTFIAREGVECRVSGVRGAGRPVPSAVWGVCRRVVAAVILWTQFPFSLHASLQGDVVAWGDNSAGQTNTPSALTDVVGIAAGRGFCAALNRAGTVTAWGDNALGQTNVPAN